jgi:hypothetical protein
MRRPVVLFLAKFRENIAQEKLKVLLDTDLDSAAAITRNQTVTYDILEQ